MFKLKPISGGQMSTSNGSLPQVYRNYNLLFTPVLISELRNLRNQEWADLIDYLSELPETHPDALAFALMMITLGSCLTCEMDSYRAQRGCSLCARHSIISFKGSDNQLIKRYESAKKLYAENYQKPLQQKAA
jgi:hypothetical protein